MKQYIIVRQFIFKGKTYLRDKTLTAEHVGADSIERLTKRGFIKPVGETAATNRKTPFYLEVEDFLTAEQVNRLRKPELLEYAAHIGVGEVNPDTVTNLREAINAFIKEAEAGV